MGRVIAAMPAELPADPASRAPARATGHHAPPSSSHLRFAQLAIIGALLLVGQLPLLTKFFGELWSRPQYQFFPIILLAAGYIAWERLADCRSLDFKRGSLTVVTPFLALSWIALTGGLLYLRWMSPVSAVLLLAAIVWWAGGRPLARTLLPAGILLLVVVPPPAHWDEALAVKLQLAAVGASSRLLDFVGIPHIVGGTVIEIPGHRLLVEEACSGINSLISVIAFSLLYGIWQHRRPVLTGILMFAGAAFVLCANVARITIGAVLVHLWHIDILTGTAHEMLGVLLFAVALGLVISFDQFLLLLSRRSGPDEAIANESTGRSMPALRSLVQSLAQTRRANLAVWWTAAICFAALGIVLQFRLGHSWASSRLREDATFNLPAQLAGWDRVQAEGALNGRPETDSLKSHFWLFKSGGITAGIAMAYPFSGFHDATICYASSGWDILGRSESRPGGRAERAFENVQMDKPPLMHGQLLFGLFDERGNSLAAPSEIRPAELGPLRYPLLLSRQRAEAPATYQVQALYVGYQPLTPEQRVRLEQLFSAARGELARQLVSQTEGRP